MSALTDNRPSMPHTQSLQKEYDALMQQREAAVNDAKKMILVIASIQTILGRLLGNTAQVDSRDFLDDMEKNIVILQKSYNGGRGWAYAAAAVQFVGALAGISPFGSMAPNNPLIPAQYTQVLSTASQPISQMGQSISGLGSIDDQARQAKRVNLEHIKAELNRMRQEVESGKERHGRMSKDAVDTMLKVIDAFHSAIMRVLNQ